MQNNDSVESQPEITTELCLSDPELQENGNREYCIVPSNNSYLVSAVANSSPGRELAMNEEKTLVSLENKDGRGESTGKSVLPSMGIIAPSEVSRVFEEIQSVPVGTSGVDLESQQSGESGATAPAAPEKFDPSKTIHRVKKIKWKDIEVPIITQNINGPCPLIAILNAMVLKGEITIPLDRSEISGGELVAIVGNAIFDLPRNSVPSEMKQHLERNTEDAVSIVHKLLTGLDVNIQFSGVRDFEFTPELCVFDVLGISLYHGWVIDPACEAAALVGRTSYNQLMNNILSWKHEAHSSDNNDLLLKAMLCEEFIGSSLSQLTIFGLFELCSTLSDEEVAVFFRNNHFSTIYKYRDQLYQLVTDQGFLNESAVWETLSDVDATFSEFVTCTFQPLAQGTAASSSNVNMTTEQQINSDQQLAAMLQQETDRQKTSAESFQKVIEDLGLKNLSDEEIARRLQEEENKSVALEDSKYPASKSKMVQGAPLTPPQLLGQSSIPPSEDKKKKDCVIL